MDRLRELQLFTRVVERESFTAVAREMGLSQPSVSRQIAALEERLSVPLLLRSTRRVKPTEAGLLLYERAKRALDELAEAEAEAGQQVSGHRGTLRVAMSLAYGSNFVIPTVRAFLQKFPKVRIELIVNDRYVDLVEEGIDVAIRIGPLEDSSYKARSLGHEELVVVAAREYLQGKRRPKTIDELEEHDAVVLVRHGRPWPWNFVVPGKRALIMRGPLQIDNIAGVLAAVREGIGIGMLPSYLVEDEVRSGALVRLVPNAPLVGLPVYAVYPAVRQLSSKVQSFIEHLARVIGEDTKKR